MRKMYPTLSYCFTSGCTCDFDMKCFQLFSNVVMVTIGLVSGCRSDIDLIKVVLVIDFLIMGCIIHRIAIDGL